MHAHKAHVRWTQETLRSNLIVSQLRGSRDAFGVRTRVEFYLSRRPRAYPVSGPELVSN